MHENLERHQWVQLPSGKVRDRYVTPGGDLVLVATDRVSAFDQVLGTIPGKGEVTTQMSAFWFGAMQDIIPHHMIDVLDSNIMLCNKLTPLPVEVVVRGYMTGVTDTSIWGRYQRGEREIYGIPFRDGYQKNDQLDAPVITPTTKAAIEHDERLTEQEILDGHVEGVTPEQWKTVRGAALAMFQKAQVIARERGFILVDTKMEFGVDEKGTLYVIDELFTPDSSRYWKADTAEALIAQGNEPENFDKEYLRITLKKLQKEGLWQPGDPIPEDIRQETSQRYQKLCEDITEAVFHEQSSVERRIRINLARYLEQERLAHNQLVVIVMGSPNDEAHAKKIVDVLAQFGVAYELRVTSAHKSTTRTLEMARQYTTSEKQIIFITAAGRSDGLSGVMAGNTIRAVIACPPWDRADRGTVFSSVDMPSGVPVVLALYPDAAAHHAMRIFAQTNEELAIKLAAHQAKMTDGIIEADMRLQT